MKEARAAAAQRGWEVVAALSMCFDFIGQKWHHMSYLLKPAGPCLPSSSPQSRPRWRSSMNISRMSHFSCTLSFTSEYPLLYFRCLVQALPVSCMMGLWHLGDVRVFVCV